MGDRPVRGIGWASEQEVIGEEGASLTRRAGIDRHIGDEIGAGDERGRIDAAASSRLHRRKRTKAAASKQLHRSNRLKATTSNQPHRNNDTNAQMSPRRQQNQSDAAHAKHSAWPSPPPKAQPHTR
jgi:hypothetical protein